MWTVFSKFLMTLIKLFTLFLIAAALGTAAFLQFSPQFGGKATAEQQAMYEKTGYFSEGKFRNIEKIVMEFNVTKVKNLIASWRNRPDDLSPKATLRPQKLQLNDAFSTDGKAKVTWLSHSSFIVQIDDKRLLLDPMLSEAAAPVPWFVKRFNKLPIQVADLPEIDAVLISHDHYDHLDYSTVTQLKDRVAHFYVPLGVGNHLKRWGIAAERITELAWWDEVRIKNSEVTLVFTPSRHMSGRGVTDNKATLWGSWVILGRQEKVFFSGDGGYGTHFKSIGEKYGAFDLALMECGQYSPNWENIHMTPEESIQAAQDIKAKLAMPIHWGAFVLSTHSWTEPAERCVAAAQRLDMPITTPRIGETVTLAGNDTLQNVPTEAWWRDIAD